MTFIDTNVLVYSATEEAPVHSDARRALAHFSMDRSAAISRQVLRVYVATTSRRMPWRQPFTLARAMIDATAFEPRFALLEDGEAVWQKLTGLAERVAFAGRQIHDANIVATTVACGIHRLLTFNIADFRRFDHLIEIAAL